MGAKLERLTPEQEDLMGVVREEWLGRVFRPGLLLDREAAVRGAKRLYSLANLPEPRVVVVDSPLGVQYALNLLARGAREQVSENPASVRDSVWASVGDSVWDSERLKFFDPIWLDLLSEAHWGAWSDYWRRVGIAKIDAADQYIAYLQSGVHYAVMLRGVAVLCGPPEYIHRDAEGRLHDAEGPAIRWRDGYTLHAWHGVRVPGKIIEAPEQLTRGDLLKETNAEVRRVMMERLGSDRFAEMLDLVEIHREEYGHPEMRQTVILLRTKDPDPVAGEHIQFVRVVCPSTGRVYHLCVPPTIEDALSGVAWTFSKARDDYAPAIEA